MPYDDPGLRMSALAERFHTLEGRPGVRPWDPVELERSAREDGWAGSGARHATAFVLSVWNPRADWTLRFDLVSAWGVWDDRHRAAFRSWLDAPWWP